MSTMDKPINDLIKNLPQTGIVHWIGIRPERKQPLQEVNTVEVTEEKGLVGDHYSARSNKRQVTLIQQVHLDAVSSFMDTDVTPFMTRRNIVVKGINLFALRDVQFQIGEVVLEGTGYCHPCSRMEENLGPGGYNAMRGHGGITARVVIGGKIKVGDEIRLK
ncbi:MOSC domain-containing protein [Marinoscillum sp.]|uniref:MOSC domain-containing protein n=1 Tax=Marinoscillum sp. TaxID=2024838 RepID=UPI003BA95064